MAARQAFSHGSLSETSTTTSGSWPAATTFTFTPDASSDYWIFFSCLFANGSGTAGHYGEISIYHDQGGASVGYWAGRSQETTSTQDWISVFCVHKSTFGASPGVQDYILSLNSSHAGDTTKVKDVRFLAIKADAADKYATQEASTSTASTSYTTRTTLTFTPASTGDYLLISSAVLTADTANNAHGARLNHTGGSIYGENLTYPKATWLYSPWTTAAKINLAASSNTFTLQYKTSANNAYTEQARILALRLDKFDNAYVAQDFTGGNTTAATDQDFLTLTQTPQAVSHAILAVAAFRTASTTVSGYLNVCKGGSNYTETPREGVNTGGYVHAGVAVKETLAASSMSWKWRARAETAGTAVHVDDLLIAVLQFDANPTTVTASASFSAAVQKAIATSASANAAVQKTLSATASTDSAVRKAIAALASADSAVRKALTALSGTDAAIERTLSAGASFDAAAAALRSAQATLDAAVFKAISAGLGADAAVQQAFVAAASLDAAVQALRIVSANFDVAVQVVRSTSAGADVYVAAFGAAEALASLDVAVQALVQAGAAFDVVVQAGRTAAAAADAGVLASVSQSVGAGAAVLATITAGVSASVAVARERLAGFGADAAVSALRAAAVGLDVAIGNVVTARPIINLDGVYGPAAALAGSHVPTVSMRGVRAATTALSGRTGKKP